MLRALLYSVFLPCAVQALTFNKDEMGTNDFTGDILVFKDRLYAPYGPDLTASPVDTETQPWTGYGYGLGATEHWAYDHVEKYVYSQSEAGAFITIIDYATVPGTVTSVSLDVDGQNAEIRDIVVCSEEGLMFVTVTDQSTVKMFSTVKRSDPKIPELIAEISAGNSPDAMKLSNDCKFLAVANQNEGTSIATEGSLTLVSDFRAADGPKTTTVRLASDLINDAYLLDRDVHMPLTKNAMEFWNAELGLEWEELIAQYSPALAMDPEFLAFNNDGTELYLNLQDNSALARISTANGEVLAIDGYGLKSFNSGPGVDIVDDEKCELVTNDCLYLARAPDGIATVEYGGVNYVLTADEGSDFDLDDYEEKFDSEDLFTANGTFAVAGFTADASFRDPSDKTQGCSAHFSADCDKEIMGWCSNFELTVGSSAVDYSNPSAPVMDKIVGFGGRGISIFRIPPSTNQKLEWVWDSASQFETETCEKFPWAHNGLQDEEFAPVNGARYTLVDSDDRESIEELNDPLRDGCEFNDGSTGACPISATIDAKAQEDGLGVETVVVGIACDHLVAVGCGENNGMCLLYDITDIASPKLLKTFNLSPASETKNPEQAYQDDLGDVDAETILFLSADKSPTGKSALLFGGAISGTLSFYEFSCTKSELESESEPESEPSSSSSDAATIDGVVSPLMSLSTVFF